MTREDGVPMISRIGTSLQTFNPLIGVISANVDRDGLAAMLRKTEFCAVSLMAADPEYAFNLLVRKDDLVQALRAYGKLRASFRIALGSQRAKRLYGDMRRLAIETGKDATPQNEACRHHL